MITRSFPYKKFLRSFTVFVSCGLLVYLTSLKLIFFCYPFRRGTLFAP